jgi:methionyl aminopeptidase
MAIMLRSSREIERLRKAGAVVAEVLLQIKEAVEPGISTWELDQLAMDITNAAGAKALFKGVESPYAKRPFPGTICASVNEQVVHGIPAKRFKVHEGDILSVDFGVKLEGYCGDAAVTIGVGQILQERQQLIDATKRLLDIAIDRSAPGIKWSEIAGQMESSAKSAGFSVVEDFVGHGIGTEMHEDPKVPNFVSDELLRKDIVLKEGMVLAVEPMVNMGSGAVKLARDGWTVVTKDGKCSAHFEHTIVIVKGGCEVLTA